MILRRLTTWVELSLSCQFSFFSAFEKKSVTDFFSNAEKICCLINCRFFVQTCQIFIKVPFSAEILKLLNRSKLEFRIWFYDTWKVRQEKRCNLKLSSCRILRLNRDAWEFCILYETRANIERSFYFYNIYLAIYRGSK